MTVGAPSLPTPSTRNSTVHEWVDDPAGRALIDAEVANGQPGAMLDEPLHGLVATMPISTLANFGGMSLDHDALDRINAAWRQQRDAPVDPEGPDSASHSDDVAPTVGL